MTHPVRTEIQLPSRRAFLPAVLNFVREVVLACGLQPEESEFLTLAAEEACSNSIEHAYDAQEEGSFRLVLEISPSRIILSLHDQGLPFDYTIAPKYEPPAQADPGKISTRGLGLYLIEKLVDSVSGSPWHGWQRTATDQKRSVRDVTNRLPAGTLPLFQNAPHAPGVIRCEDAA